MRVKLKDVTNFSKGQQINGDELLLNGRFAFVNGGINPSGQWNESNTPANTIAISEGGNSCGHVNFFADPIWCGAHCYYLFDTKYDSKYLYYALKSQQDRIMALRSGACMPNIKKNDLGNFEFTVCDSKEEQQRVVAIFDRLDTLISLRKQQIAKLDELVKARFVEMFDGIHDSTKYPYVTIDSFTSVMSGGTPDRGIPEYWTSGTIRWVKTTELQNCVIHDTEEHITQEGLDNSSAKLIPAGSILIAMYGQGKTRGMTGFLAVESTTNQACACILPSSAVNQTYLWQYMILSYDKLRDMAKGGNQPNLNAGIIKAFPVLMPPMELQNQFAAFVAQTDQQKLTIQHSLAQLELLKKALMQKYFG